MPTIARKTQLTHSIKETHCGAFIGKILEPNQGYYCPLSIRLQFIFWTVQTVSNMVTNSKMSLVIPIFLQNFFKKITLASKCPFAMKPFMKQDR